MLLRLLEKLRTFMLQTTDAANAMLYCRWKGLAHVSIRAFIFT